MALNVIPLETEPQPVPSKAVLYAKLARVMGKVKRVAKGGENTHFGYKFVTDADVADMVRGALADEKVAFLVNMLEVKNEVITLTNEYQGKTITKQQAKIVVVFEFTFACGDTGATITKVWEAEAMDSQDKGINKAATAAVKYFLLKTFLISTGKATDDPDADDPDADAPAEDKAAKPAKPAKPQRRIDTSRDAPPPTPEPAANGKPDKAEGLFQYLMKAVKHPRYQVSEARANAINKLLLADLLPDGDRAKLVKRVEHYATLRDDGKSENEAMLEVRKELTSAHQEAT